VHITHRAAKSTHAPRSSFEASDLDEKNRLKRDPLLEIPAVSTSATSSSSTRTAENEVMYGFSAAVARPSRLASGRSALAAPSAETPPVSRGRRAFDLRRRA
jgi:hypothetical protein